MVGCPRGFERTLAQLLPRVVRAHRGALQAVTRALSQLDLRLLGLVLPI